MSEDDVQILRKALQNQQITVQKLQAELDEERKAAASGAEEALSMILRLQGEKSTQKMESLHYKRVVEEKLQHSEEAMAVMREIIFLKDTETEALRYQIDVCKSKLLSLFLEGGSFPWLSGYISGKGEHNLGRKNISLPSIRFEELCREIDDLKQGNAGSFFDTKTYKERKLDNLFRSKSSIKEICTVSDGSKSESYDSEGDFSSLKLHHGEIPYLTPQKKWPRRTASLALLHDSCTETEPTSNPQDRFEIPESLKGKKEYNLNSGNEERVQKSMTKSYCEHDKVSTGCVEIEMRKMRESDSVALKKQMELLAEIHEKINALESHILQRDDRMEEESSDRHKQMTASYIPQLIRKPSTNQLDDQLISYYMEAMLSFFM